MEAASESPASRRSWRLWLSVAVIVALWALRGVHAVRTLRAGTAVGSVASMRDIVAGATLMAALFIGGAALLLRLSGERLRGLGIDHRRIGRQLLVGLLVAVALVLLERYVTDPALRRMGYDTEEGLAPLFTSWRSLPLWLYATTLGGGVSEETLRAFVLSRFDRALGRRAVAAALVIDSAVFGLSHAYQGVAGVIGRAIFGFALGLTYLRRRRILESISAHALYDYAGVLDNLVRYAR